MSYPFDHWFVALTFMALTCLAGVPVSAQEGLTQTSRSVGSVDELPAIKSLPDPFRFNDGSRVSNARQWLRRREEIKSILLEQAYGHLPPAPGVIHATVESRSEIANGRAEQQILRLAMGPDNQLVMRLRLLLPKGTAPSPVVILNAHDHNGVTPIEDEIVNRGYALAAYNRNDLDPDQNNVVGAAQRLYPDYDWATIAVWAWGAMRTLDYLETLEAIDAKKVAVTGHSRGGKTALLAGALDERFAVVVPNGSGCGGSGCFRVLGENSETLEKITDPDRFAYWFHPRLREFAGKVNHLPFDSHFLKCLVAPRGLLSTDALGDEWANPLGTQVTFDAAQHVFDFLAASDRNAQTMRQGGHDQNAEDWRALLDFCDVVFRQASPARDFRQRPFGDVSQHFLWRRP